MLLTLRTPMVLSQGRVTELSLVQTKKLFLEYSMWEASKLTTRETLIKLDPGKRVGIDREAAT